MNIFEINDAVAKATKTATKSVEYRQCLNADGEYVCAISFNEKNGTLQKVVNHYNAVVAKYPDVGLLRVILSAARGNCTLEGKTKNGFRTIQSYLAKDKSNPLPREMMTSFSYLSELTQSMSKDEVLSSIASVEWETTDKEVLAVLQGAGSFTMETQESINSLMAELDAEAAAEGEDNE